MNKSKQISEVPEQKRQNRTRKYVVLAIFENFRLQIDIGLTNSLLILFR